MSLDQIIGAIIMGATLISILVVWFYSHRQLREVKNQVWVSIYSDYTKRYADITSKFPENINQDSYEVDPGKEEYPEVMRAMRLYFDLCYEEYSLFHDHKKIDEGLWKDWKGGIEAALSKKAFRDSWDTIHADTVYSAEFDKFVNETIASCR